MIDENIESRRSFPWPAVLWLVPVVGFLVGAVLARQTQLILFSLPFLFCGLFFWLWPSELPFKATFGKTGFQVNETIQIPYEGMQALIAGRRPPNPFQAGPPCYPILIVHSHGVLRIPRCLNVPSDQVYAFLYTRFNSQGNVQLDPELAKYRQYNQKRFGAERVWSYRVRQYLGARTRSKGWQKFFLALLLASLVWIVFAALGGHFGWINEMDKGGWFAVGLGIGFVSGIALLLSLPGGSFQSNLRILQVPGKLRQASMVITPEGIALSQADMQGQMRWNEVRHLKFVRNSLIGTLRGHGIVLQVDGGAIVIPDIYDRPLPLIHQLMLHYWSADKAGEKPDRTWHFDPERLGETLEPAPDQSTAIRAKRGRAEEFES